MLTLQLRLEIHTYGIFPRTGRLLENEACRRALKFAASKSGQLKLYNELIDFLFCELFTSYRKHCVKYYEGLSPPLCEHPGSTPERIQAWDEYMVLALKVAFRWYRAGKKAKWKSFRKAVETESKTQHTREVRR
jgi:hypothetical protein